MAVNHPRGCGDKHPWSAVMCCRGTTKSVWPAALFFSLPREGNGLPIGAVLISLSSSQRPKTGPNDNKKSWAPRRDRENFCHAMPIFTAFFFPPGMQDAGEEKSRLRRDAAHYNGSTSPTVSSKATTAVFGLATNSSFPLEARIWIQKIIPRTRERPRQLAEQLFDVVLCSSLTLNMTEPRTQGKQGTQSSETSISTNGFSKNMHNRSKFRTPPKCRKTSPPILPLSPIKGSIVPSATNLMLTKSLHEIQ